jgi:hypothetical protein
LPIGGSPFFSRSSSACFHAVSSERIVERRVGRPFDAISHQFGITAESSTCFLPAVRSTFVTVQLGLLPSRAYNSPVGLRRLVANPRRQVLLLSVRAKRLTAVAGTN